MEAAEGQRRRLGVAGVSCVSFTGGDNGLAVPLQVPSRSAPAICDILP